MQGAFRVSEELAKFAVTPLKIPKMELAGLYTFRNRFRVRRKPLHMSNVQQMKTKKKVHWYEMEPFDDPVLEQKRLKCLSQKIWDDKKRYELEILKEENKELKEENESLKNKILCLEVFCRSLQSSESVSENIYRV